MKIAILDDYAGVATQLADWSGLGEISVFRDTVKDEDALVARLEPFGILCVMRERTPLPARVIARLPNLAADRDDGDRAIFPSISKRRRRAASPSAVRPRARPPHPNSPSP